MLSVRDLPFVKFVSPEFIREFPMTWGTKQGSYRVRGVAPDYAVMRSQWPAGGPLPR